MQVLEDEDGGLIQAFSQGDARLIERTRANFASFSGECGRSQMRGGAKWIRTVDTKLTL